MPPTEKPNLSRISAPADDLSETIAILNAQLALESPAAPAAPAAPVAPAGTTALPVLAWIKHKRVFLTGRLKVGKDHLTKAAGAAIAGLADPLYAIQKVYFGTDDKTVAGARAFLQTIGQWGRNTISPEYPITPTRALFRAHILELARHKAFSPDLMVDWKLFGKDENIWLDALIRRVGEDPKVRTFVTNVRFENEFRRLKEAGWTHYHVMCSKTTWENRLAASGLNAKSPEVNNLSEKFAEALDKDVVRAITTQPQGQMLRVVWNDDAVRPLTPRLWTVQQFVSHLEAPPAS